MNVVILLAKVTLVLTGALVLAGALRRANPRWRMLVCETAAVGVLALPLLSLMPLPLPLPLPIAEGAAVEAGRGHGALEAESRPEAATEPAEWAPSTDSVAGREVAAEAVAAPARVEPAPLPVAAVLVAIYLGGCGVLLARGMVAARRMRRALTKLMSADERVTRVLEREAEALGMRAVPRLLVTDERIAPLVCGWRAGTIVIPRMMLEPGREQACRMALRHELHHLANRDLWRGLLLQLVAGAFWFHPLSWALRRSHLLAMEELSDRVAAGECGLAEYARMLAAIALALRDRRAKGAPAMSWFSRPQIVKRLRRLERGVPHGELKRPMRVAALIGVAVPAFLAIALVGVAQPDVGADVAKATGPWLADELPKETVERAREGLDRALAVLLAAQRADGSVPAGATEGGAHECGTTALAGMAFFRNGGATGGTTRHEAMLRCLDYVLATRDETGLFRPNRAGGAGTLYHHCIAIWFLASVMESVDAERKAAIAAALPPAVGIVLSAQRVEKAPMHAGGWRYTPESKDSDLSCTAWAMQALLAARESGQEVPAAAISAGGSYLLRLQNPADGGFAYTSPGQASNASRTGMALAILQQAGHGDSPEAASAADYLLDHASREAGAGQGYPFYGIFWGASAMAGRGGADARRYAEWMYPRLGAAQHADGSFSSGLGRVIPTLSAVLAMSSQ